MANINVWSKVAVAVQSVLGTARSITAITKANPPVLSCAAHGFVAGNTVLLKVNGMRQLDWRVVRVLAAPTADTFTLEGIDATLFDTFVASGSTAQLVTLGVSAGTFQDVSVSGGEAAGISIETIHDDQSFEIPGNRSPIVFSMGSLWDPSDPALQALAAFDDTKTPCAVQFTFATGAKILMAAFASASLAPTGSSGQPVTTPVSLRLRGRLTTYAS